MAGAGVQTRRWRGRVCALPLAWRARACRRVRCRGKSEAPRAALRAEACAPPGATPGSEGDPPPIDLRALAFSSTNVIARRSLRFGGRSAFADCLPGCPDPSSTTKPLRSQPPPVARLPLPSPRPPARPPRLPGSISPATPLAPPKVRSVASRSSSYRPRFHLVNPVGPPLLVTAIAGCPVSAAPFLGFRLACAVRYVCHCAPRISAGQEVFSVLTGLSTGKVGYAQKFLVHPLFTHRLCTGNTLTQPVLRA